MRRIYYIILAFIFVLLYYSCGKMDDTYKEYVIPNGIIYPGKATSPFVSAGKGRVQVSWLKGTDPKVVKAKISWNNFTDSVEIKITQDLDTIRHMIQELEENSYTFIIKTYDTAGNVSIPVEISGNSYGQVYQSKLSNRRISSESVKNDEWTINWDRGDEASGAIYSELFFKNNKNEDQTVIVPVDENITIISNFLAGSECRYRTVYLPESTAIDSFYTDYTVKKIPSK